VRRFIAAFLFSFWSAAIHRRFSSYVKLHSKKMKNKSGDDSPHSKKPEN